MSKAKPQMSETNDLRQPDDRECVPSVTTGDTKPITTEGLARLDVLWAKYGHGSMFPNEMWEFVKEYPAIRARMKWLAENMEHYIKLSQESLDKIEDQEATIDQQAGRIEQLERELRGWVEGAYRKDRL